MTPTILAILLAAQIPQGAITVPTGQPAYQESLNQRGRLTIKLSRTTDHLMGLRVRMGNGVKRVRFDHGVFSMWRVFGTSGADALELGPTGTVINRRMGGMFDMGNDRVKDSFTFTNVINVAACSEKHGYPCHPLNHLQQVTIKNFGPEDEVILQGRLYTYRDLRGNSFPGVPVTRLKVEPLR